MMKILSISFVTMFLLSLLGCQNGHVSGELTRVDSLLDNNQLDSAKQILNVMPNTYFNKECYMYYNLLVTRAKYMSYEPIHL